MYPVQFLACVAWGHHWRDLGSYIAQDKHGQPRIEQRFECGKDCGGRARAYFSMRYVRLPRGRDYDYPDGYSPTPTIADARIEWFRRYPPK